MFRSLSRVMVPIIMLAAVTIPSVPAASVSHAATAVPPYARPYAQTLTVNIGQPTANPLPPKITMQNNPLIPYLNKMLNIKINIAMTALPGPAYDQKVALSLASGNMPDILVLRGSNNLTQLHQLADAGMIEDVTGVFKSFAPFLQGFYKSNPVSVNLATINGKVMAVPSTLLDYQTEMLWVRQDWLTKLHLAAPKTLADIETVAKAFVANKMGGDGTIGLGAQGGAAGLTSLNQNNGYGGFDTIIQAYGAYQGDWIAQNHKVVYGSTLPGMKDALSYLHKLYAEGLIDPQFISHTSDQENSQIFNGKVGMFLGPWWAPIFPIGTAMQNNPKQKWVPYIAPLSPTTGKLEEIGPDATGLDFIVVRKGFAHPEVAALINNLEQQLHDVGMFNQIDDQYAPYMKEGAAIDANYENKLQGNWQTWPLMLQILPDQALFMYLKVFYPYLQKHDRAGLLKAPGLNGFDVKLYDEFVANPNPANPKQLAQWIDVQARVIGQHTEYAAIQAGLYHEILPLGYYPTPTMLQRSSILQKQEMQTFIAIIVGQQPLSAYDSWLSRWHSLGGDKITAELTQQVKSQLG